MIFAPDSLHRERFHPDDLARFAKNRRIFAAWIFEDMQEGAGLFCESVRLLRKLREDAAGFQGRLRSTMQSNQHGGSKRGRAKGISNQKRFGGVQAVATTRVVGDAR